MNRDEQILALQQKIETEELKLKHELNFKPKTNTIIECFGSKINLRALNEDELSIANIIMNILTTHNENITIGGYKLEDYNDDCIGLLSKKLINARQMKLAKDKKTLEGLLSEDKKADLLLEKILKDFDT